MCTTNHPPLHPIQVGVSISNDVPHTVLEVTELMDPAGVIQGETGYSNPETRTGDVLFQAGGMPVAELTIKQVIARCGFSFLRCHDLLSKWRWYECIEWMVGTCDRLV